LKTIAYIGTSLDSFIARKNGDIDWLTQFANDEAIHSYEEFMKRIDAIVIGRGTFEKVLSFPSWPYEKKVFVLSSTMKQLPDKLRGLPGNPSLNEAGRTAKLSFRHGLLKYLY
jgi:dihydrofolate reductase